MRQLRRVAQALPVCLVPLACYSPVGLEDGRTSGYTPVLPSVEGEWLVTTSEMVRYLAGAASGSCQAVEFGLDLDRTAERRRYEGSHRGFTVLCVGRDGAGAEFVGVTDLALSVDPGPITAEVVERTCWIFEGRCPDWQLSVDLSDGFSLSTGLWSGQTSLTKGSITWTDGEEDRVVGGWTALRCSAEVPC